MVSLLMDCHVTIKVVRTFKCLVTTAAQKQFLMCAPLGINIFETHKRGNSIHFVTIRALMWVLFCLFLFDQQVLTTPESPFTENAHAWSFTFMGSNEYIDIYIPLY